MKYRVKSEITINGVTFNEGGEVEMEEAVAKGFLDLDAIEAITGQKVRASKISAPADSAIKEGSDA